MAAKINFGPDEEFIKNYQELKSSRNGNYSVSGATSEKYLWFAAPVSYGNCTFVSLSGRFIRCFYSNLSGLKSSDQSLNYSSFLLTGSRPLHGSFSPGQLQLECLA